MLLCASVARREGVKRGCTRLASPCGRLMTTMPRLIPYALSWECRVRGLLVHQALPDSSAVQVMR